MLAARETSLGGPYVFISAYEEYGGEKICMVKIAWFFMIRCQDSAVEFPYFLGTLPKVSLH